MERRHFTASPSRTPDTPITPLAFAGSRWCIRRAILMVVCPSFVIASAHVLSAQQQAADPASQDAATALAAEKPKAEGHWGEDAVGFRWVEEDSADDRWKSMQIGPFLCSSLPTPSGMVNKAISIRVGDPQLASVAYCLERLQWQCCWTGGFLRFTPARFGVIAPPTIDGAVAFTAPSDAGWRSKQQRFLGIYRHDRRVVLSYELDGCRVLESPWAVTHDGHTVFFRTLRFEASPHPIVGAISAAAADSGAGPGPGPGPGAVVQLKGGGGHAEIASAPNAPTLLTIAPRAEPIQITLIYTAPGSTLDVSAITTLPAIAAQPDLTRWTQPGKRLWQHDVVTRGRIGDNDRAYTIDTIGVPFENPYQALMFLSGHDFFAVPGKAAVCTLHGDVWLVDGIDDTLTRVTWRRFATGLYQPLGLKIIDDDIYVLGRDRLTRLHDRNDDGEADYYESFNADAKTSAGGHDYSTCLETDAAGNFYYVSEQGVHQISADGSRYETIATGLRNPNGIGIGPGDIITAAPQEGDWTPASAVFEITPGGYYGFGGPRVTPDRPMGFDQPLFWLPRRLDNSTGGQVWAPDDRWGPLSGSLLTLSFGQCRLLVNPLEPRQYALPRSWPIAGDAREVQIPAAAGILPDAARYVQGGSFALPLTFDSGAMRGRFSPHDGQLYVTGLRGWVSAAAKDGCFQRVRFTGREGAVPITVRTLRNGMAISFSADLAPEAAEAPDNYDVRQWNYHYGSQYGSADYRVSDPQVTGHDSVTVKSATLLDARTIFLEMESLASAMQLSVAYTLRTTSGVAVRDTYYHTINHVPAIGMDATRLTPPPVRDRDIADRAALQPGLRWHFRSPGRSSVEEPAHERLQQDMRVSRMAALYVPAGAPATPFLEAGPFEATAEGYLHVDLPDDLTFSVEGNGTVRLRINHAVVLAAESHDLATTPRRTVPLYKGLNHLQLEYKSPSTGDAELRVRWSSDQFATESIPPHVLACDTDHPLLKQSERLRRGRTLVARLHCTKCHELPANTAFHDAGTSVMPELFEKAPDLSDAGNRLQVAWVAQWLAEPNLLRRERRMPHLLHGETVQRRQSAADLAAYLGTLRQPQRPEESSEAAAVLEPHASANNATQGARLFWQLGCVTCHTLEEPTEPDPHDRLSLALVLTKFPLASLVRYLRNPHEHFPANRMPNFQLSQHDSQALADYLQQATTGQLAKWTDTIIGTAAQGKRLFGTLGCAACHSTGEEYQPIVTTRWHSLGTEQTGCLAATAHPSHRGPSYDLSAEDAQAIASFLPIAHASLQRHCAHESAARLLQSYSCTRCHERDGQRAIRMEVMAEAGDGTAPELLPNLTWTGEKLHTSWTEKHVAGRLDHRIRPWLAARMPAFPQHASTLARGLAEQHGLPPSAPQITTQMTPRITPDTTPLEASPEEQLRAVGQQLVQKTGLDCVQCHGIGPQLPRGDNRTQLAQGINFADIFPRLRPDYYLRFVLDPPRFDIRTAMPKLAADGRRTQHTELLDGDARRQFQAIWKVIEATPKATQQ